MQYIVPKFIGREPKIVGPFSFKQFIFIGIAGTISFVLYFMVPLSVFILSCVVLGGSAFALAFLKIGGRSLPEILTHFFNFSISPKIYIWKKKEVPPPKLILKKELKKIEPAKKIGSIPKIAGKSRLKNLAARIETKIK